MLIKFHLIYVILLMMLQILW